MKTEDGSSPEYRSSTLKDFSSGLGWLATFIVGLSLLGVNVVGQFSNQAQGYSFSEFSLKGWPIIISAHVSRSKSGCVTMDCEGVDYYGTYPIVVNVFFGFVMLACTYLAMKFLRKRLKDKKHFYLQELLILTTSTAIVFAFLFNLEFNGSFEILGVDGYTYQPLHTLPLIYQIPLWFGVLCFSAVLGTVVMDIVRFLSLKERIKDG
jgi:hypothetical protein